ncbi:ATP-binding protein [Roseomonas sp. WA12]
MDAADDIRFGAFTLRPRRKQLLRDGEPVSIGQRALDLLIALAQRPGEVLDRDALLAAVWPGRQVEESNLRAQVALLRKALGDGEPGADSRPDHVLTVPGRGYSLVTPIAAPAAALSDRAPPPVSPAASALPMRLQPVLGREAEIEMLTDRLRQHRFVSIIGAGGIGKTTVALAVARHIAAESAEPPRFLDLGAMTDGTLVSAQVLAALEGGGPTQGSRLVLLDSCEPVIGAAAELAERILRTTPAVQLLATSREPLRAEGEWSYRLPSMESPPAGQAITVEAALRFPAVALLAERLQAAGAALPDTEEEVALAAQICRQLDGIPLAIELAATRAAQLGLRALAERLDDRFRLLMQGRRTALPRHQTLRATLDWSHGLLPSEEQRLLRRLAIFQGCFTLDAAVAVGGDDAQPDGTEAVAIVDRVARLLDKSFLAPQPRAGEMAYRCLDTTRLYLLDKMEEAGEFAAIARRHARHFAAVFREAEALWAALPVAEARARLAPDLDNLRGAIDWALGPGREPETGIALTLSGVPLWSALGMIGEAGRRLEAAIAAFQGMAERDPRLGMRLYAALGTVTVNLDGTLESAWVNTLIFAERLGDTEHRLRALNGLTVGAMRRDYREALDYANRFRALAWAEGQPDDGPVGDRLVGYIQHMRGEQAEARRLTESMLARYPRRALQPHQTKLNFFDQRILSKSTLATILWLQGETEAALILGDETVAEAKALEHPFSQFFALGVMAGPLALLSGDLKRAAAARTAILEGWPSNHGWVLRGRSFLALEMMAGDQPEEGLALLREQQAAMSPSSFNKRLPVLHAGIIATLLRLGRPEEALPVAEAALADARASDERWFEPEYARLRGECLVALDAAHAPEAEAEFRAALEQAEAQTARAWSLRLATSLARLRRDEECRARLAALLTHFPAALDTPDLRAARALLATGREQATQ